MAKSHTWSPGTNQWPDWDWQPPFIPPKGTTPREMPTHDDMGYRIADREREPGEDG